MTFTFPYYYCNESVNYCKWVKAMSEPAQRDEPQKMSRRQLLGELAKITSGLAMGAALLPEVLPPHRAEAAATGVAVPPPLSAQVPQDQLIIRMQREMRRALEKPVAQRKWVMVVDLRKCVGCSACTVGCKAENKLPPGVVYRPVIEEEYGSFPHVARRFLPRPCMHCDNPPCTKVCPVAATFKRPDGIVAIDYEKCIGCRYCIAACPYDARTFDWGEYYTDGTPRRERYEVEPSLEYGKEWPRQKNRSPVNNTRKCHFCLHRQAVGMLPMCVTTCIGRATYFGDSNDQQSLVAELIANPRVMRLKEELGTEPSVYYLL